jgi:hypothetical protein
MSTETTTRYEMGASRGAVPALMAALKAAQAFLPAVLIRAMSFRIIIHYSHGLNMRI